MHTIRFQPGLSHPNRVMTRGLIDAVLDAANPSNSLQKHFDQSQFTRPTHILAFGKASIPMASAAIECLGDRFSRATIIAPASLCASHAFKSKFVELIAADHPIPMQRNIDATNRLIEHAHSIPNDHQVLVLISGGGSAMLCSPRPGITLEYIAQVTQSMIRSGESIHELNAQRSKFEILKAGGLADVLAHVAQIDAYVLSDVTSDNLRTIASGPLIDPDENASDPQIKHTIIASNNAAVDAMCLWCACQQFNLCDIARGVSGFAQVEGTSLADRLVANTQPGTIVACLGGEPTVDTQSTTGIGGPMLELALSCALQLATGASFRWTVITMATDGIDGPTNAMGAMINSDMLDHPDRREQVQSALDTHNSLQMCDTLGATIRTGPTGTNVNDVAIAIRWDESKTIDQENEEHA